MATENFTTYTEIDPNSHITVTSASKIDFAGLTRNEDAYVYKNFGADYFGNDFTINFDAQLTSGDASINIYVCALANLLDDGYGIEVTSADSLITTNLVNVSGDYRIYLKEASSGALYNTYYSVSAATTYYLTMRRNVFDLMLYLDIYSDSGRTTKLTTLSLELHQHYNFKYLYPVQSYNSGHALVGTGFVQNLEITSNGVPTQMANINEVVIENFTSYTEVDSTSAITVSADTVSVTDSLTTASHVYLDKGAEHYTGLRARFNTQVTGTATGQTIVWGVSDVGGNFSTWTKGIYVKWNYASSVYNLIFGNISGTTVQSINLSASTTYYCEVRRHYKWAELWIATDAEFTNIINRLIIRSIVDLNTFRYAVALSTNGTTATVACSTSNRRDYTFQFQDYSNTDYAITPTVSHDGETYPGSGWTETKPTGSTIEQSGTWKKNGSYSVHIIGVNATTQDFTTYTETDPNSHISKTASTITFTNLPRNEDAYVYKDFGSSYFTDFTIDSTIGLTAGDDSCVIMVTTVTNSIDDARGIELASGYYLSIYMYKSGTTLGLILRECDAGTAYNSSTYSGTIGTTYYLRLERAGTAGTLKIYSDAARSSLLTTLSLTLHTTTAFRYLYGVQTYNSGHTNKGTGTVSNIAINSYSGDARLAQTFTASTNNLWTASANVRIVSVGDGSVCQLFGIQKTSNSDTIMAGIYRSGNSYVWSLMTYYSGTGLWTKTDSAYEVKLNTDYHVVLVFDKDPVYTEVSGINLLVDGVLVAQISTDSFLPSYVDKAYIGYVGSAASWGVASERYIDDFYFRKEKLMKFGSMTIAVNGDIVTAASLTSQHFPDTNASVKIMTSSDYGVTWTLRQTIDYASKHDFALGSFVNVGNNIYVFVDRGSYTSGNQSRTDVWKSTDNGQTWSKVYDADVDTPTNLRIYPSRLVESNKILCGYLYLPDADYSATYLKFVTFDTTTDTFDTIPSNYLAYAGDFTNCFPGETDIFRRPSDNALIALITWSDYAATTYHGETDPLFQTYRVSTDNGATWSPIASLQYRWGNKAGRFKTNIMGGYLWCTGYHKSSTADFSKRQSFLMQCDPNTFDVINEKQWSYGIYSQDSGNGDSYYAGGRNQLYIYLHMGTSLGFYRLNYEDVASKLRWWERQRKRSKTAGRIR